MSIRISCLGCGAKLKAPDKAAGTTVGCPKCGEKIAVSGGAILGQAPAPPSPFPIPHPDNDCNHPAPTLRRSSSSQFSIPHPDNDWAEPDPPLPVNRPQLGADWIMDALPPPVPIPQPDKASAANKKFCLKDLGATEFIGPFSIDEIRALIQKGTIGWNYQALEASGQSFRTLNASTNWVALSSVCPPESLTTPQAQGQDILTHQEQSPGAFLEAIRKRSCYSELRTTIEVFTVISIMGVVITGMAFFIMGLKAENGLLPLLGVVVGVLGIFLVVASKEASLLLVDIADTLIEQNRKKGETLSDKNQKKEKPPLGLIKFFFP